MTDQSAIRGVLLVLGSSRPNPTTELDSGKCVELDESSESPENATPSDVDRFLERKLQEFEQPGSLPSRYVQSL